jgi:hypothetical protein
VKVKVMNENERFVEKIREEFARFEGTMEELHFLKSVAQDLKSFRKMIKLKRYD